MGALDPRYWLAAKPALISLRGRGAAAPSSRLSAAEVDPGSSRAWDRKGWKIGAAWPRRVASRPQPRPGRIQKSLVVMGDPVSVRTSGSRTEVRHCPSTRIPSPSHAAAAACLSTSGPPAFFGTRRAVRCPIIGHDRDRSRSRATRRATAWSPLKRRTPARQRGCPALAWLPWPLLVRPCPRATANMAYGAFAMRRPPTAAQSQRRHMGHPTVPFSQRRTLRPGYATLKAAT